MKRTEFKMIIKALSVWTIDKRKGNYKLPSGKTLRDYLEDLALTFLKRNYLAITSAGTVEHWLDPATIHIPFRDDEPLDWDDQAQRVHDLISEMLY